MKGKRVLSDSISFQSSEVFCTKSIQGQTFLTTVLRTSAWKLWKQKIGKVVHDVCSI